MARTKQRSSSLPSISAIAFPANTELVGLVFELKSADGGAIYPQYAIGLHAWFLDQVRQKNPELSAKLHDDRDEKSFTLSGLEGKITTSGRQLYLEPGETYRWYLGALSRPVVEWMESWLQNLPTEVGLRDVSLKIKSVAIAHPPTNYTSLLPTETQTKKSLTLSFVTPTSFRRKGVHLSLPIPSNVFHSYLRRWNNFSGIMYDQEEFLQWVDECVWITRHRIESVKVAAGKKGMVTGFTGAVEFSLTREAKERSEFVQLFYALGKLAPYCGTGHKTTFGLGQTRLGWLSESSELPGLEIQLAQRIEELTEILMTTQKRTGGERARDVSEIRATILARREFGESLQDIAADLEMPYETVKTYVKLARKAICDR